MSRGDFAGLAGGVVAALVRVHDLAGAARVVAGGHLPGWFRARAAAAPRSRFVLLLRIAVIGWIGRGVLIVTAVAGLEADCAAAVICVPGWTRVALVLPIVGRFREPVVGLLGADAVPGLGLWRQHKTRIPQQAVGDQLRGALPALQVAARPAGCDA